MPAIQKARQLTDAPELMSIGQLAERTGVAATTLRYYDELELVRPATRSSSGRRSYASSAVADVGVIRFLGEVGFSLAEIRQFLTAGEGRARRQIVARKLAEVTERQHRLEVARELLEHGQSCPAEDPTQCPRFWSIIDGHLHGLSLEESHARGHETQRHRSGGREPSPARSLRALRAGVLAEPACPRARATRSNASSG